jgi:hypothetical protein
MTTKQLNYLLALPAKHTPSGVSTLHKRQRKMGLHLVQAGDKYRLRRNDGTLGQSAHRSVSSFCRKYSITSVYHYSSLSTGELHVEVTHKEK